MRKTLIFIGFLCALLFPSLVFAQQGVRYDSFAFSAFGRPIGGVLVSVCTTGLATTSASVTNNVATFVMSTNPQTAGFVAGMSLTVFGFTSTDTYLNGNYTITSVTSTTITFPITHANATASTVGMAFQTGNVSTSCAPLATIYSDINLTIPITQPGLTSDGLGNYGFWGNPGQYNVQLYGSAVTLTVKPVTLPGPGSGGGGGGGGGTTLGGSCNTPNSLADFISTFMLGCSGWVDTGTLATYNGTGGVKITNSVQITGTGLFAITGTEGASAGCPTPLSGIIALCSINDLSPHGLYLSDDGGAYFLIGTGGGGASGYNTVQVNGVSSPQRQKLNFLPTTNVGVACPDDSGNSSTDCAITGVNGPPAPNVNYLSASTYTIANNDNTWRDVFTNTGSVAVTLPQANTIVGTAAFVSAVSGFAGSCNPSCTTSSFTQSGGNQGIVVIKTLVSGTITNVTSSTGDSYIRLAPDQTNGPNNTISLWYAKTLTGSGSATITVTASTGLTSATTVYFLQYLGTTFDHAISSNGASPNSLTVPTSNVNEIALAIASEGGGGCSNAFPSGWIQRGGAPVFEKNLSGVASVTWPGAFASGCNETDELASFGQSGILSFVDGWYTVLVNDTHAGNVVVTPTVSTINGQTSLTIAPNEHCAVMSDGANYNAICGFQPNIFTNGVMGGKVEIAGINTSGAVADVGATTLITTGASDAFYEVNASVTCRSAAAGTETVTITYTDTNGITQTFTAVTGTCSGGTPTQGNLVQSFRAKAATAIQYTTTHASTQPNYDVSAAVYQLSTN
jgi:hypothetical protein